MASTRKEKNSVNVHQRHECRLTLQSGFQRPNTFRTGTYTNSKLGRCGTYQEISPETLAKACQNQERRRKARGSEHRRRQTDRQTGRRAGGETRREAAVRDYVKATNVPHIFKELYNTQLVSRVRTTLGYLSIASKVFGEGSVVLCENRRGESLPLVASAKD